MGTNSPVALLPRTKSNPLTLEGSVMLNSSSKVPARLPGCLLISVGDGDGGNNSKEQPFQPWDGEVGEDALTSVTPDLADSYLLGSGSSRSA